MNLLDFVSVRLCISFVAGICLGWMIPSQPSSVLLPLLLCLACLFLTFFFENYRNGIFFGICVLCTSTCLGFLTVCLAQPKLQPGHYSRSVAEAENFWEVRVKEVRKPSAFYNSYLLEVRALNGSSRSGLLLGKGKLDEIPRLYVDDRLLIHGPIQPIPPPSNPHQFAFDKYMESLGVYDQIDLKEGQYTVTGPLSPGIRGRAERLRDYLISTLRTSPIQQEELAVLQAILMGQRNDLDPELYGDYKDAGAAHILAVSGLHIGIILLLIRVWLKPLSGLRHGKSLAGILSIVLIWAYAVFTGLSPSVVRAATMFSFLSCALYLNRPTNTLNILALSMLAILLVQPLYLLQVGFQLSYAAVIAIAWIYPLLIRAWIPRTWFMKSVWKLTAVSLAAQTGVLPICLYYFHQFPTLFLLSAILLIPFLSLVLGLGIPVVILSGLNSLPEFLALAYADLIGVMNHTVGFISDQEAFVLRNIAFDKASLFLLYLILGLLVLSLQKPRFRNLVFLGMSILSIQAWTLYRSYINLGVQEVFVLQQVANSGLLIQDGREVHLLSSKPELLKPLVQNFRIYRYLDPPSYGEMPRAFSLGEDHWVVLDSSAILPPVTGKVAGLLLTHSPKIHLERMLNTVKPGMVIADGSNFPSDIKRWRQTCQISGIPFYSTAESGAFRLNRM